MLYYGYLLEKRHRLDVLNSSIEYTLIQLTRRPVLVQNGFRCTKLIHKTKTFIKYVSQWACKLCDTVYCVTKYFLNVKINSFSDKCLWFNTKMKMNGYSILQEPDTIYHHQMNLSKTKTASFFRGINRVSLWLVADYNVLLRY